MGGREEELLDKILLAWTKSICWLWGLPGIGFGAKKGPSPEGPSLEGPSPEGPSPERPTQEGPSPDTQAQSEWQPTVLI